MSKLILLLIPLIILSSGCVNYVNVDGVKVFEQVCYNNNGTVLTDIDYTTGGIFYHKKEVLYCYDNNTMTSIFDSSNLEYISLEKKWVIIK